MPVPTRRLAMLAALLSVVVLVLPLRLPWSLLVVDGGLVVLALVDWLLAGRPDRLDVERDLPPVLALGGGTDTLASAEQALRARYGL